MKNQVLVMLGGLLGWLAVTHVYPIADRNIAGLLCLFVFFAPLLLQIVITARGQLPEYVELVRNTYKWSAIILVAVTLLLLVNGVVDRSPAVDVHSYVAQKYASRGRYGTSYHIDVSPSWRAGRQQESVDVSATAFYSIRPGEAVTLEVHRGALRLSWVGRVIPE